MFLSNYTVWAFKHRSINIKSLSLFNQRADRFINTITDWKISLARFIITITKMNLYKSIKPWASVNHIWLITANKIKIKISSNALNIIWNISCHWNRGCYSRCYLCSYFECFWVGDQIIKSIRSTINAISTHSAISTWKSYKCSIRIWIPHIIPSFIKAI